jgi:molybdenum cofactor biosynthesis enzyme MoaA
VGDRYRLKDGRILNRTCEVNIVEHCNLRCRSCTHLSPVPPKHFVDPGALSSDLTTLARSYHANVLKILGGEPPAPEPRGCHYGRPRIAGRG